jgi:uncharacterized RDD family membrane protein YckC
MALGPIVFPISMTTSTASLSERLAAAMLNLVIGCFPVSVPNVVFRHQFANDWAGNEIIVDALTLALGLIQLLFIHSFQGSPGAIFSGLRVQTVSGAKPSFMITLVRSVPYLMFLALVILMPRHEGNPILVATLTIAIGLVFVFLAINAAVIMFNGTDSLIDKLTGTVVVKAHSIFK